MSYSERVIDGGRAWHWTKNVLRIALWVVLAALGGIGVALGLVQTPR